VIYFFETFWRSCEIVRVKQIILLLAALALFACQKSEVATSTAAAQPTTTVAQASPNTATPAMTASLPPGHPAMGATAGNIGAKVTGTVAETFDAAGYTYLKLKTASGEEWAAVRQTPVKQGQTVTMSVQMTAEKFESKTLKRTFDRILFGALEDAGTAAPAPQAQAQQHMSAPAAADTTPIKVAKAEGSDAKSVAEVWASRDALKDGKVVVRGKVVKFLGGIMGKNWIHLRDGSGSAEKSDNDITVTTNDTAAIGDVVVISGVVHVDKDFGAGYRYPVIIEEAKVTK
jgi:hypothetical protein